MRILSTILALGLFLTWGAASADACPITVASGAVLNTAGFVPYGPAFAGPIIVQQRGAFFQRDFRRDFQRGPILLDSRRGFFEPRSRFSLRLRF